jgi:hypothetical protein
MRHSLRRWFVAAALTAVGLAGAEPAPAPAPDGNRPAPYVLPPVGDSPIPPRPDPDPLLDQPEMPAPGMFINVEADIFNVHLRNQLMNTVTIGSTQIDTIAFPGNRLDWSVAPRFEIGKHLPDGLGDLFISYRFLVTSGSDTLGTAQGDADQHGRLVFNVVDLDYASREFSLAPNWDMKWTLGARAQVLYFDSRLDFANPAPLVGTTLAQDESNFVHAYGVHAGVEVSRKLGEPGCALVGQIDGAGLFGRIKQTFTEDVVGAPQGETRIQTVVGIPTLTGTVAFSYTVPEWNQSRLLIGYQFETWFNVGKMSNGSNAQLDLQGLFLRAEINY